MFILTFLMQNMENGEGRSQGENSIGDAIDPGDHLLQSLDTDILTGKAVASSLSQRNPAPHFSGEHGVICSGMLVLGRPLTSAPSSVKRKEEEDHLLCPSPSASLHAGYLLLVLVEKEIALTNL